MTTAERIKRINQRAIEHAARTNAEIDKCKMAYRIQDCEGNIFCFGGIENGIPWYRGNGGAKHIFGLSGMTILEQYITP